MFGRTFEWANHLDAAVTALANCTTAAEAAEELSITLDHPITSKALLSALRRAYKNGTVALPAKVIVGSSRATGLLAQTTGQQVPGPSKIFTADVRPPVTGKQAAPTPPTPERKNQDPELMEVVRAVQKGIRTWHALADHLDRSPKATKDLVEQAVEAGHDIQINATGELAFEMPPAAVTQVPDVPTEAGWTTVGVMSDMHVGSKHCMEDEMSRFCERAYQEGARQILIPGDLCEGNLRHHGFEFEVKEPDYDGQVELLFSLLPELKDLKYYFCVGNHEVNSWFKSIGMRPDRAIERDAHAIGRYDIISAGAMTKYQESAFLLLNPGDPETEIKVELSHTSDKKAYAISYPLQKHVEGMQPGTKPHVLLKGHLHCHSFFDLRGVVCVQTGCFKDQGTWERQKNMSPQVGGVVLSIKHEGAYFEVKNHWMSVRPPPRVWQTVGG